MAVWETAFEVPGSPQATFALGKHTIVRKFKVRVSSPDDGPMIVSQASGLPRLYEPYLFGNEYHPYCLCREVDPQRVGTSNTLWEVTCTYETPDPKGGSASDGPGGDGGGGGGGGEGGGNDGGGTGEENPQQFFQPELAIPEVETHMEDREEGIQYIINGDGDMAPLANSAGGVLMPPPHRIVSSLVLTISRNESILAPHPALSVAYQNSCNSDVFWGCTAGQVRCTAITCQRQVKQLPTGIVYPYLRVTYQFKFRQTWDLQYLDHGSQYLESIKGVQTLVPFMDANNNPIDGLLDGTGHALAEGGNPVYITQRIYPRLAFGALNLPQGFARGVQ